MANWQERLRGLQETWSREEKRRQKEKELQEAEDARIAEAERQRQIAEYRQSPQYLEDLRRQEEAAQEARARMQERLQQEEANRRRLKEIARVREENLRAGKSFLDDLGVKGDLRGIKKVVERCDARLTELTGFRTEPENVERILERRDRRLAGVKGFREGYTSDDVYCPLGIGYGLTIKTGGGEEKVTRSRVIVEQARYKIPLHSARGEYDRGKPPVLVSREKTEIVYSFSQSDVELTTFTIGIYQASSELDPVLFYKLDEWSSPTFQPSWWKPIKFSRISPGSFGPSIDVLNAHKESGNNEWNPTENVLGVEGNIGIIGYMTDDRQQLLDRTAIAIGSFARHIKPDKRWWG